MATLVNRLTISEFESRYRHEKPYYEFWHGEPVQKSMATWIHGLLQRILMELLGRAGFKAASEVTLRIDPDLQFIPDVIATRGVIESTYPTKALEVVIEILSENDSMSRVLMKCRTFRQWGFEQICVVDPIARTIFRWMGNRLEAVDEVTGVPVSEIWSALDLQLNA